MKIYQIRYQNGSLITKGKAESLGDFVVKSIKDGFILCGANLTGVDLRGADLSGALLIYTDLSGADLSYADLTGVDFRGAHLSGADLSGADLTDVQYDKHIKGFDFDLYFDLRSQGIDNDAAVAIVTL